MYNIPSNWKIVRFRSVFDRIIDRNNENNQNVLTISAQMGLINQEEFFNKSVASTNKSNYYLLEKGDFAYNKSYSNGYPFGAFKRLKRYQKGIVSPLYICFRAKNSIHPGYYEQFFESRFFDKEIQAIAQEGARNHGLLNMSINDFYNTKIPFPPLEEQKKIANILSTWDRAIEINQEDITYRKSLLSGLTKGLTKGYKKIEGFQESIWKNTSLDEVFIVRNEKKYASKDLPLYSFTIEDGVTPKSDRYNREFLVKGKKRYKVSKYQDLVFNPANLKYGAIAVNDNKEDVLISPIYETLVIKDTNKYDIDFFKYLLTHSEMIKFYKSKVEGTLIERSAVKVDAFLLFQFDVPSIEEQIKIANILKTIDKSINLMQKEVEMLKLQKKGLMQQLLTGKRRVQS